MLQDKTLTYISLFSCAGVGCHGFAKAGFECIATNELIERRINIQRFNHKCRFDTGYICGDITKGEVKERIFAEIRRWEGAGNGRVDVLVATPPCQGMSVANHKKTKDEIVRNSLVVESIKLIQRVNPVFFIFENVPAFLRTGCTAPDGTVKAIGDVIREELCRQYTIAGRILNFKNYGSESSRTRTMVIGVSKDMEEHVAPIELYPSYCASHSLREVIGGMPRLEWGEICESDFYHAFRTYPEEMRRWVHGLGEGECAFDNERIENRPHQVIDGKIVLNKRKNEDKYTRQSWNKVGPCIHTRNDQLASQNTIHPEEDRVFSIRELMKLMTIPDDFKWVDMGLEELNHLHYSEKQRILKKEEINIRQSIGEAVPTQVFYRVACNIRSFMGQRRLTNLEIGRCTETYGLCDADRLASFMERNPMGLGLSSLARLAELANAKRENNAAYYTNKPIINEIYKELPEFSKEEIHILEPSVGVGSFLPFIFRKYEAVPTVYIDVIDIDSKNLRLLQILLKKQVLPPNVHIRYIHADFLLYEISQRYDLVVGNPPFSKLKAREARKYLEDNFNKDTTNVSEFFLEKALKVADYVVLIMPKVVLNTPEFAATRKLLGDKCVSCIQDFGEKGFKGVLVETICFFINTNGRPSTTKVQSIAMNKSILQKQRYIMDDRYPYWLIYRDSFFDRISKKMDFDRFTVFRDRQITSSNTTQEKSDGCIRVLRSRNISDDGRAVIDIPGYDTYIEEENAASLNVYRFVDNQDVYLTPNMTYKPRVMKNPGRMVVNGSVAVLVPKGGFKLSKEQMEYFSSEEYRCFYRIARNYQTRSLNVDASSVFFYGVLREDAAKRPGS